MIGKMADEKEFEEKTGSSGSEEEEEDEEDDMANGRDDVDEDESEFDDPEGFVDDITDEGNSTLLVGFERNLSLNLVALFHLILSI